MNKLIDVLIINVLKEWVLVEYDDDNGHVQRKLIPWSVFPHSKKGSGRIQARLLSMGIEYSNVDLPSRLGDELPTIRVCDLQDALRREGLWSQEDYRSNPQKVSGVLQRLRGADTASIIKAASLGPKEIQNE